MTILTPDDTIVVSLESFDSTGAAAIVESNIQFINSLRRGLVQLNEISREALLSYYVDYYLYQYQNGGFSQFIYNSEWEPVTRQWVEDGLSAIGSSRHLALYRRMANAIEDLGGQLQLFLSSDLFGENDLRDELDALADSTSSIDELEDLEALNARWIRSRPTLIVLPPAELDAAVALRCAAIPDHATRLAKVRASEHRWLKHIRALCAQARQELVSLNAGEPGFICQGQKVFAHHFSTNLGHHYMIELDGSAMMFNGSTGQQVTMMPALPQPPSQRTGQA